ncbi:MAG: hypothetical protein IPP78_13960 [Holophagaceae bacterium]|nr:hypothetical protein [Holophagaceae bacterium]
MFRNSILNFMVGLFVATSTNPGHARMPAVWVGPYDLTATLTQEPELVWGDPAKPSSKLDLRTDKAQVLKNQRLKEQGGDAAKAVDALMARRQEPDAAQALYQAMVELATGKVAGINDGAIPSQLSAKETKTETKSEEIQPYAAPQGKIGIALVAGVAKALGPKMGQPDMKPFDQVLFEHSIRLMGFHGAPPVADAKAPAAQGQAASTQAPPPIDPEVRATLRSLLGSRATQVYAARALGQLGDLETAKEIIDHPGKYPDASISDFGTDALNRYKVTRKQVIAQGKGGGEAAFWQSTRIPPQHQDAAIELAMLGDGGAGVAVMRNWAVMNGAEKDLDEVWANGIDAAIRFPGTRAAWIGLNRCVDGFFNHTVGAGPKTYTMILKALEHDLKIVFSGQPWKETDTVVLRTHEGIFCALWHVAHRHHGGLYAKDRELETKAEALFRKNYKPWTNAVEFGDGQSTGSAAELALYAAHLKLPPLQFPGKDGWIRIFIEDRNRHKNDKKEWKESEYKGQCEPPYALTALWGSRAYLCEEMGDIESVDKI